MKMVVSCSPITLSHCFILSFDTLLWGKHNICFVWNKWTHLYSGWSRLKCSFCCNSALWKIHLVDYQHRSAGLEKFKSGPHFLCSTSHASTRHSEHFSTTPSLWLPSYSLACSCLQPRPRLLVPRLTWSRPDLRQAARRSCSSSWL